MWFLLLVLAGFFGHREWEKSKSTTLTNPFLEYNSEMQKNNFFESEALIVLGDQKYSFNDLPKDVQFELFKEKQQFHEKQAAILKGFATRVRAARQSNPGASVKDVPPLVSFIDTKIPPAEIDKLFEEEKAKYPANVSPDFIRNQIQFTLVTKSVLNFYITFLKKLYDEKILKITTPSPTIPLEWLKLKEFPKLGSPDAKNHLVVLANYTCISCRKLNDELSALYLKHGPESLEITFVPYGKFHNKEDFLSRSAMCAFQQDVELFWKFHIGIFNKIKSLGNSPIEEIAVLRKWSQEQAAQVGLNSSNFSSCLSDKNSALMDLFSKTISDFRFLDVQDLPIFILNNSKLDLEGRSLLSAFEEQSPK